MQKSITHSTLNGLFWVISGAGFQAILRLVVFIILARLLTPADFGIVNAASIVIGFSEIFSLLGVGPAIVQRPNLEDSHLRTGFTVSVFFGLLMASFLWLFSPSLANFFQMEELTLVIRVLVLVFPLHSISVIAESLLQRELQFRWLTSINLASFIVGYGIVGVSLALASFGIWALVGATLSQAATNSLILLIIKPHPKLPQFDRAAFDDLIHFGGGFTIARIFNYIATQGDYLVVGRWLGAEALGLYGRAYQLMVLPANLLGQALDKVLFPAMAKVQEEPKRLAIAYRRSITLIALIILPTSAALFALSPEIIHLLLGPAWTGAIIPFQILTIGMLFRTSYKVSDSLARAKGAVYKRAWIQGVYATLILAGAWLGHYWGISGVAIGVLIALSINFLLMAQLSLRLTFITWRDLFAAHIPASCFAVITYVSVWLIATFMRSLFIPNLAIISIAGTITLAFSLLLSLLIPQTFWGVDAIWLFNTIANTYKRFLQKHSSN
ncbi:lipopolysaccharide biosynthesis protein [Chroogloeocystis siderophila]|uniref:lipopolysaccharide biosynthesis protein n=1 Tax=Chroogloeocystis siderophila TaxID=329163 RepID=UPI0009FB9BF6|nr:lipopolysaccharide biosynthesis protein [Chroogloeocystis siderophila]